MLPNVAAASFSSLLCHLFFCFLSNIPDLTPSLCYAKLQLSPSPSFLVFKKEKWEGDVVLVDLNFCYTLFLLRINPLFSCTESRVVINLCKWVCSFVFVCEVTFVDGDG